MRSFVKNITAITLISLIPTLLIWLPFFLRAEQIWGIPLESQGMGTVVANYDGPLYIAVAKTMYDKSLIAQNFSFGLPTEYYAAHFPMYPILIKAFAGIFGFPYSMLFVTAISSVFATYMFYLFIKLYVKPSQALFLTFLFSIFPARWLIVRSVGSPEPLFVGSVIASIYFFKKQSYLFAAIWGAVAQLTKSPAILLFAGYFFVIFIPLFKSLATSSFNKISAHVFQFRKILPILSIPLSLLLIFFFYKLRMNDFWAYFNSGDNIHLFFPPFQIFNYSQSWVGTFWLEEVIFVYLIALLGLVKLIKKKDYELSWFVGIFLTSIFFVSHRDIVRYSLPIVPFLFAAFSKTLVQKEFRFIILILIIPIYLFSLAYISQNVMPISDWTPLL